MDTSEQEKSSKVDEIMSKIRDFVQERSLPEQKIKDFVSTAINGDSIKDHHVIFTVSDNQRSCLIFVLTNQRLVRMDVGNENKSREYALDDMSINWISGEYEGVKIDSPEHSFSIKNIDDEDKRFFKTVGEARLQAGC